MGRDVELPILHMPQMVALALGCTEQEIGLKVHVQKAKTFIMSSACVKDLMG